MSNESYITTEGTTLQEAVDKALKALRITREQANVEIISEGKQGFLGLGSKVARVKVSIKEEAVADLTLNDILADLDIKDEAREENYRPKLINKEFGIVEVREGKIIVTNPVREGKYSTVKPGKHVILKINGKLAEEEAFLKEEDNLEVEFIHDQVVSACEVQLSEDKVLAYVRYVKRPGAKYRLKDQEPTNRLILLTEVEDLIEPEAMTSEELKAILREHNVVKGIFEDKLQQVLDNPNATEHILIAQGQAPIEGKDARVEYPYTNTGDEEELFGRTKLISVQKGEIVACKIPKVDGVDGWTVTGEVLKAREASDLQLMTKKGCELVENGAKAAASLAGRPVFEVNGNIHLVSVEPVFEVKNVDQTTGDIKFSGDVEIKGDVKEGFAVEAEGNVEVLGDVTRATIKAGASVRVHKMVLGSTIVAGGIAALYSSITPMLGEVKGLLEKTFVVASQLKDAPGFKTSDLQTKGDGQLIQLLMDSKFQSLPKLINDLSQKTSNSGQPVNEEVTNVINLLQKSLCGLGPLHLEKLEFLQILIKAVGQTIGVVSGYMVNSDSITARYVQNSTLSSSGDVIIEGQGCYITTVQSGGEVIVTGNPGIARGVKISAQRNVTIKELGSEFDTQTSIAIKGNGKLSAELIHPNVTIQVGTERFRVDKAYKNFDAYINHEGRLVIDKLLAEGKHK